MLNFDVSSITDFTGAKGALGPMLLASKALSAGITLLVTTDSLRAAELTAQIKTWLGSQSDRVVAMLPERETIYDQTAADSEVIYDRLGAMSLERRGGGLVVIPASVLLERFFAPSKWIAGCFELKTGYEVKRAALISRLVELGYKRVASVEERSVFSVKGSLVDIFPPDSDFPYRLDFFGDDLETIKVFSPQSQRSIEKRKKVLITPVYEFISDDSDKSETAEAAAEAVKHLEEHRAGLLERKLEHFQTSPDSRDYKELRPFVEAGEGFVFDYWKRFSIILDESDQILDALAESYEEFQRRFEQLDDMTPLKEPSAYYHKPGVITDLLNQKGFMKYSRFSKLENPYFQKVRFLDPPSDSSRESLLKDLRMLTSKDWSVAIVIEDDARLSNLKGLMGERKVKIHSSQEPFDMCPGKVLFIKGKAARGFKDYDRKLAVFGENDIFTGPAKENSGKKKVSRKNLLELDQIIPGDYVVHVDHGIAEFRGIQTVTAAGRTREYMVLQYAGEDKLYVPTDQVHRVSKYMGMEGYVPRIHSLSSKAWVNQKAKVKKNIEYIARDLLELYADRIANKGYSFAKDNDMMRSMEAKFPFIETPDQMRAIEETKHDMESDMPMDRLVCGDVGYGKTEVAMRAAFKAVCSGKQVAVLAPTTLLAFQHYQNFINRFEGFPVTVDLVSRLRSAADQKETLAKLKAGTLDVLIGTHRILSNDIHFRDLGLIIIDEEQRFGVKHKEKLKKMKTTVDALTLTATPIPRTMQMAMSGLRQISIIDTPPKDRKPVQTYVAPFDPGWIKRAIIEELKRGGQIYYVYNRVGNIERKAAFIKKLVPEARVAVAHGQMDENQVEKIMLDFVKHQYDVLLATTIIESGLDISNVNTLIVDEAERLGLSQMYQLRGRVGRSPRRAWAYFFYTKGKKLSKDAAMRLETIEEHTALGSGFKIAMKDLQIRGAGNILGETQSGHIAGIGLSLYMEMLEDAVVAAKSGNRSYERVDAAVEIPATAYFPVSYISEEETRVEIYARLARCTDTELLTEIKEECEDRFGPIPEESKALFSISLLRILANKANVKKISRVINHLRFEFANNAVPDIGKIFSSGEPILKQVYFDSHEPGVLNMDIFEDTPEAVFSDAVSLMMLF